MNELNKARELVLSRRKRWQETLDRSDWNAYLDAIEQYRALRGAAADEVTST
jgi:hypothetical protein